VKIDVFEYQLLIALISGFDFFLDGFKIMENGEF
jgi:hypothetical protein